MLTCASFFLDVIARYIRGNFSLSLPFSNFVSDSADRTCKEAFQAKDIKKIQISLLLVLILFKD